MSVEELIVKLQTMPKDLPVVIYNEKAGGWSIVEDAKQDTLLLFSDYQCIKITDY